MYDTLLYGATLTALGMAMRNPKKTLILEPSGMMAPEFAHALRFDWGHVPGAAPARQLLRQLIDRAAADERGRAHIPAVAPVAALLAREAGVQILFHAQIIGRKEVSGGLNVSALCLNQRRDVRAKRLIDTTSDLSAIERHGRLSALRFHSLLLCEKAVYFSGDGFEIAPTYFDCCALLSLATDAREGYARRRARVIAQMQALPEALSGHRLLSTAHTVCATAQPLDVQTGECSWLIPSCGRTDYLEALDYGFERGGDFL